MALRFKETYDKIYKPDELLPIDVIEFVESKFTIRNQDEYANAFYAEIRERCEQNYWDCDRDGVRIYINATNGNYYIDAIGGQPIKIYGKRNKDVLVECPEDAHVAHAMHCIEEYDKTLTPKTNSNVSCPLIWKIAAISGWITSGILLAYILLS